MTMDMLAIIEYTGYIAASQRTTLDQCPYPWRPRASWSATEKREWAAKIDAWFEGYGRWFDEHRLHWDWQPK